MGQVKIGDRFVKQQSLAVMNRPGGLDLLQGPCELEPTLLPSGESRVGLGSAPAAARDRSTIRARSRAEAARSPQPVTDSSIFSPPTPTMIG